MTDEKEFSRSGIEVIVPANEIAAAVNHVSSLVSNSVDASDFRSTDSRKEKDERLKAAYALIETVCGYHFVPNDGASPFQPMMQFGDGRSLVPSDMKSDQIDEIILALPSISNPGIRARFADAAWTVRRSDAIVGFLAIDAYCDSVEAVEAGEREFSYSDKSPTGIHGIEVLTRTCWIMRMMGWKRPEFERPKTMLLRLLNREPTDEGVRDLLRIAALALDWGFGDPAEIAAKIMSVANDKVSETDHDLRAQAYQIAARSFHFAKDETAKNQALVAKAECSVEKARTAGVNMIRAAFLKEAIEELIAVPGTADRREELKAELREVQPLIRDEMSTYSHETDLTEIVKVSLEVVRGETFPRAIFQLFNCDRVPAPEDLRKGALDQTARTPLASLFPASVFDRDGRVVFQSEGGDFPSVSESQLKFQIAQHQDMRRQLAVRGTINPIRHLIQQSFPFKEHMLLDLIRASPFVPNGQEAIFSKGANAFLHSDDIQAAHLLVPQLENSIRHLLQTKGTDTTSVRQNGLQEVASLSVLLSRHREALVGVFGEAYVHEIDLLFDFPGGPRIRNDLAHGLSHSGEFYGQNMIYAVWLILHLVFKPLFSEWSKFEEAFAFQIGHRATDSEKE